MNRKNLFGLTLAELEGELAPLPKFRAKQIAGRFKSGGTAVALDRSKIFSCSPRFKFNRREKMT